MVLVKATKTTGTFPSQSGKEKIIREEGVTTGVNRGKKKKQKGMDKGYILG